MSEISISNGIIVSAGPRPFEKLRFEGGEFVDIGDFTILPGFIDVHCHGAAGVDVNTADAEGLLKIGMFLARHGVTGWMPTLVPDSQSVYERAIRAIDEAMIRQEKIPAARILGVHYEGVFANLNMCGALHKEHFRMFTDVDKLESLPLPKTGARMMTFAPEIEGGLELAETLADRGWVSSIGHTKASAEVLEAAYDAGAKHLTHFYNAMSGIHHRDLGVAGWGLTKEGVTFDIIADGIHVKDEMLLVAVNTKGIENVSLISDSIAPTGLGDGEYQVWGEEISVNGGETRNMHGNIAGSVITVLDAVRMMLSLGYSETDVSEMASLNPARILEVDDSVGSIEAGKRGDFVLVDTDMTVSATYVGGKEICCSSDDAPPLEDGI